MRSGNAIWSKLEEPQVNDEPTATRRNELISLEASARATHLMNTAIWPVFVTLFLGAVGITAQNDGATKHPALYLFLCLAGVFVCIQWSISVAQTRRRYQRLWREIREFDPAHWPAKERNNSFFLDVFWRARTSIWKLRGESLPIVFGIVFAFFCVLPLVESTETEWFVLVGAIVVFFGLLCCESIRQYCERRKDRNKEAQG